MKKKSLISLFVLPLTLGCLFSCAGSSLSSEVELSKTTDKYRTYYQIFPYSYADSNGDGIGDLKGIEDKLDYIDSLHYDGIYLNPICSATSYHKYDVRDYYNVDSQFGTLDDFDSLVNKAHEKGMTVVFDLVINHTSLSNSWFTKCFNAHINENASEDDLYYKDFYPIVDTPDGTSTIPYTAYGKTVYYEQSFSGDMADLNLKDVIEHPDGNLATELKKVIKFWLVDHDVDGFRLDAVTSFFGKSNTIYNDATATFLKWFHDYAVSLKEDVYIVGEGSWGDPTTYNKPMQAYSGIDSFFNFQDKGSQGICGMLSRNSSLCKATYFGSLEKGNAASVSSSGISSSFIANHDTGRLYGASTGSVGTAYPRMAHALLQMLKGDTYLYYGDEAGMSLAGTSDPDIRQPMPWGDSYTCTACPGTTSTKDEYRYKYGTVASQLEDADSLPNYVKKVNYARRLHPAISHSDGTLVASNSDSSMAAYEKKYGNDDVIIAINASKTDEQTLTIGDGSYSLSNDLSTSGNATLSGKDLTVPALSVVVLNVK